LLGIGLAKVTVMLGITRSQFETAAGTSYFEPGGVFLGQLARKRCRRSWSHMRHHERIESFAAMSASLLAQLDELSALGSLFVSSGVNRLKLAWKILARVHHVDHWRCN
jgi:hypothetical protein